MCALVMFRVGTCYHHGHGVAEDEAKAVWDDLMSGEPCICISPDGVYVTVPACVPVVAAP